MSRAGGIPAGHGREDVNVLMEGIVFGESPRWHDGRVWFSDWGAHQVIALDPRRPPRGGGDGSLVSDVHRLPARRAVAGGGLGFAAATAP